MAPRLRDDLVATITEEDGVACVQVTDPISGSSFRFYDFEYALAQQLNGQPVEAVTAWASTVYGVDLGPEALDAFIEKLAGLGFLVGGSSGAQPAVLTPPSSSSSAHRFDDAATTAGAGGAPVPEVPTMEAFAAEIAASVLDDEAIVFPVPPFANAAAPEGLISGDATEYQLKGTSSGLWERPRPTLPAAPAAAAEPSAPVAAPPRAPDRLPPGLEMLGGPLPAAAAAGAPESRAPIGAAPQTGETPLGSIAAAIAVEPGGPAPLGALDAGAGSIPSTRGGPSHPSFPVTAGPSFPVTAGPSFPVTAGPSSSTTAGPSAPVAARPSVPVAVGPSAPVAARPSAPVTAGPSFPVTAGPFAPVTAGPPAQPRVAPSPAPSPPTSDERSPSSWAAELVDQVDHPPVERRQSARPELVVMPPTPAPSAADASVAVPLPPRRSAAALVLVVLAGAAAAAVWFLRPTPETASPVIVPSAPIVHTVSPQPTTFYRWFEAAGTVSPGRDDTLSFSKAGRLQDAMPPGTTFGAGETIARLKGVAERELIVNKIRSRLAYLEQLRDSSRAVGDAAVRAAEAKLAVKRKELADAQKWQAEMEIRAKVAGEIGQLLVAKGAFVPAGAPVFHVRAAGPQATFALGAEDTAKARALGFCRVETIPGTAAPGDGAAPEGAGGARAIDCALTAPMPGETRLTVDLTSAAGVAPGTQVRLASARYDGVFPVARSAVVHDGNTDRVWLATSANRLATSHPVEIAATIDDLALVSRGLSVGDAIIVDPPGSLKDGAEINVAR